ncbi:uncharacterized protein BDW70DRAFT_131694 [Aspergillus foveolatus]|uniref:uncharacterized protein n=1 Tax=Aspergillus foveolatus TaxID=210207 RepID=UPI003CCDF7B9
MLCPYLYLVGIGTGIIRFRLFWGDGASHFFFRAAALALAFGMPEVFADTAGGEVVNSVDWAMLWMRFDEGFVFAQLKYC